MPRRLRIGAAPALQGRRCAEHRSRASPVHAARACRAAGGAVGSAAGAPTALSDLEPSCRTNRSRSVHGPAWKRSETCGNLWKLAETCGNAPETSGDYRKRSETSGNLRKRSETSGDYRKRSETSGNLRKRSETSGDYRKRSEASGNLRKHSRTTAPCAAATRARSRSYAARRLCRPQVSRAARIGTLHRGRKLDESQLWG
jgi:hypothetical protein